MIVQDEDPDVVRWGLNLLEIGESFSTNADCSSSGTRNSVDYGGEFERESDFDSMQSIVENDAMLAHALQEELSHLAEAEASGASNVDGERLQASILAQDWLGPTPSSNDSLGRKENDVSNVNLNVNEEHQQTSNLENDWFGPIPTFDSSVERKEDDVSIITEEHQQTSILDPDWFGLASSNQSSGHEVVRGESDGIVDPSSSCSSLVEKKNEVEDWLASLESDEFSALDGEVGKRLNQMVPIPHVPKINGDIPSADEAISDHQRLLDRLQVYDLVELKVPGDGNCQFRALSDQFYRTPEHHKFIRQQIVHQLKSHRDIYEGYVPMAYDDYLKNMARNHEWGDHVTLQAAADSYGVKIFVVTSFKDTCYIEILPHVQKSKRIIFLSFWAEVHYNSIYPEIDMPEYEKKKKRWWDFLSKH